MSGRADNPFRRATFLRGAQRFEQLPPDAGREVAFAGRSNVGKSSLINALAGQRRLVRTSRTPGRTREINFFEAWPGARLVDLPGYGYAKVSQAERAGWGVLMARYLAERRALAGVIVVMDIRHPFRGSDRALLMWLAQAGVRAHVVLNKADKLSHGGRQEVLRRARREGVCDAAGVQIFSSVSGEGVVVLRRTVAAWLAP
jgi:GTP-binding protein